MRLKRASIYFMLLIAGALLAGSYFLKVDPSPGKPASVITNVGNKDISYLTKEAVVVPYVKQHHRLPPYYISKSNARKHGWNASSGNLCKVLPGKAIGGDIFTNRERRLPYKRGRIWYEADLNYTCGRRNADRLLFSNDGFIYITHDHYKTFQQQ